MQVTVSRSAKTLSPSHVKQCILSEARFDFLRDLVKNIPDVSAAEEKEMQMSAESSPSSSRSCDIAVPSKKLPKEELNHLNNSEVRTQLQNMLHSRESKRACSTDTELSKLLRTETVTSQTPTPTNVSPEVIDLSKKDESVAKPMVTANFYQETLPDDTPHRSVITVNPTYANSQPSTSNCLTPLEPVHRIDIPVPTPPAPFYLDIKPLNNNITPITPLPISPVTTTMMSVNPIINIDFTKNIGLPEIKVLDSTAANMISVTKNDKNKHKLQRQNSKPKMENKRHEIIPVVPSLISIDHINSGNLQIDEDYDT